jgi:periplasmic mercuric ion binding protein
MKILTIITMVFLLIACGNKTEHEITVQSMKTTDGVVTLASLTTNSKKEMVSIPTVQCGMCDMNITGALEKVSGVQEFLVNIDDKNVHVIFDEQKTDLTKIEKAISMVGYQANQTKADPTVYDALMGCCKLPKDRNGKGMM